MEWTLKWPEISGYYWFYGWCFRERNHEPELHYVKVRRIANGVALITNGHLLYKAEGAYGMWATAELPTLPPLPPEDVAVSPDYTYHTRRDNDH